MQLAGDSPPQHVVTRPGLAKNYLGELSRREGRYLVEYYPGQEHLGGSYLGVVMAPGQELRRAPQVEAKGVVAAEAPVGNGVVVQKVKI